MKQIEIDRTDEEREELVKQWIKDYWLMVVIAVLAAVAAVYGINYYRQSKIDALSETAAVTQQVGQALRDNQLEQAEKLVLELQTKEQQTTFSALSTLSLAQKYFNDKAYAKAIEQYDWLISHAGDMAMRNLGRLRKARAQANDQQIQAAVTTLNSLEGETNLAEANLLKGDILLADNQLAEAEKAYQAIPENTKINQALVEQRLELINIKQQQ